MKLLDSIYSQIPSNNRLERIWKIAQVDFKRRYYNDRLGLFWALIKPVFEAGVYYFVFKQVLKSDIPNLAMFIFLGLIVWTLFTELTKSGIKLLQSKRYLIENIQFNRDDLYISHILSGLMGFSFNFFAFMILFFILGLNLNWNIIYFPIVMLIVVLIGIGTTMILCNLQPFLKDIDHIWDMGLLLGLFGSGIFYDPKILVELFDFSIYVNPFLGIMHNLRATIMGTYDFNFTYLFINSFQTILILIIGIIISKKYGPLAIEKL